MTRHPGRATTIDMRGVNMCWRRTGQIFGGYFFIVAGGKRQSNRIEGSFKCRKSREDLSKVAALSLYLYRSGLHEICAWLSRTIILRMVAVTSMSSLLTAFREPRAARTLGAAQGNSCKKMLLATTGRTTMTSDRRNKVTRSLSCAKIDDIRLSGVVVHVEVTTPLVHWWI
jgi:hypothetical protein